MAFARPGIFSLIHFNSKLVHAARLEGLHPPIQNTSGLNLHSAPIENKVILSNIFADLPAKQNRYERHHYERSYNTCNITIQSRRIKRRNNNQESDENKESRLEYPPKIPSGPDGQAVHVGSLSLPRRLRVAVMKRRSGRRPGTGSGCKIRPQTAKGGSKGIAHPDRFRVGQPVDERENLLANRQSDPVFGRTDRHPAIRPHRDLDDSRGSPLRQWKRPLAPTQESSGAGDNGPAIHRDEWSGRLKRDHTPRLTHYGEQ